MIPWLESAVLEPDGDALALVRDGARTPGLVPVRAFPASAPSVIALRGRGIVAYLSAADLDPASRAALDAALAVQVFSPMILAVESLTYDDGVYSWRVRTDAGPRAFRTRQSWTALPVARGADGALTIAGDDGVRYRIPDPARLDPASRRLLAPLLIP